MKKIYISSVYYIFWNSVVFEIKNIYLFYISSSTKNWHALLQSSVQSGSFKSQDRQTDFLISLLLQVESNNQSVPLPCVYMNCVAAAATALALAAANRKLWFCDVNLIVCKTCEQRVSARRSGLGRQEFANGRALLCLHYLEDRN